MTKGSFGLHTETVEPRGERGAFQTFVNSEPMFSGSIDVSAGETVERDYFRNYFIYAD